jgi:hypothetical protein
MALEFHMIDRFQDQNIASAPLQTFHGSIQQGDFLRVVVESFDCMFTRAEGNAKFIPK